MLDSFSRFILHPSWVVGGLCALILAGIAVSITHLEAYIEIPSDLAFAIIGLAILQRTRPWCQRHYLATAARREQEYLELMDRYDWAMCQPCTCHTPEQHPQTVPAENLPDCVPSELESRRLLGKSNPSIKAL